MARDGAYFNVLGKTARSKQFSLDPKTLPDETRPAWGAIRDGFQAMRQAHADAAIARGKVEKNNDLTPEARQRRIGDVDKGLRTTITSAVEKAKAALGEFQAVATERVRTAQHRDPLKLRAPDWSKLADSDAEVARMNFEVARRLDMQLHTQARDRVDRLLDRAFAADESRGNAGLALDEAYASVLRQDDPVLLCEFEGYGRARIEAEGTKAQQTVFAAAAERVLEDRVGDSEALLLDHLDAVTTAAMLLEAAAADPKMIAHAKSFLGETLTGEASDA